MSTPTGCQLSWAISADDIKTRTSALVEKARAMYDSIGVCDNPTLESVAQRLAYFEAYFDTEQNVLVFPKNVFPSRELRDASVEATRLLSDLDVELAMRKDVYDKFVALQDKLSTSNVSSELKRFVERKARDGKRNGLHLDEVKRKKFEELSKEENNLGIDFKHALNEENTKLEFSEEELAGCPEDFIKSLKSLPSGKREITLKYPDYFPAMERCTNPNTRKSLEKAFNSRCKEQNYPILTRLMQLRKEKSALLGFDIHADYVLDIRMAKNARTVENFLDSVAKKLKPLTDKERSRMLTLKKEECERLGLPYVNRLEPSDFRYYMNLVKIRDYSVDQEELKKYFPLKAVKNGILELYQSLLGLRFTKIENPDVWHSDVDMYSVHDTATNDQIGFIYLDLHPRDGKYGHAAVFPLQANCLGVDHSTNKGDVVQPKRQLAIGAIVANFTSTSDANPHAFMLHDEVETFFHEFGHLMHLICERVELSRFGGLSVETDFVECPSQMLENWVWTEQGLKAIVGDSAEPIPRDILDKLLNSRLANVGLFYTRQCILAMFDQQIHGSKWNGDHTAVYSELSKNLLQIEPTPGSSMPATFNHMAGGYDARYYGYMWSLVFSADMYETRFKHAPDGGCLSPTVGLDYRRKILQPGSSKDAIDMLRDFLGREPKDDSFFRLLGIST